MQVVIDIPDYLYKVIQECKVIEGDNEGNVENVLTKAVENGVVLPKGHGRLIDADVLVDGMEDDYEFCEAVNATPTIIEADKESEDKE